MNRVALSALFVLAAPAIALAHVPNPTPFPMAGALGPLGLAIAGAGYVGYRVAKARRK